MIFSHQAEKGIGGEPVKIKVGSSGTNIVIPDDEVVTNFWLDDLSQVGIDSDGDLQPTGAQVERDENNQNATVLHLRRIEPIHFPNLLKSPDGSTLLTAVSRSQNKRKVYTFRIIPVSGHSACASLTITPAPEPLSPVTSNSTNNSSELSATERLPNSDSNFSPQPTQQYATRVEDPQDELPVSTNDSAPEWLDSSDSTILDSDRSFVTKNNPETNGVPNFSSQQEVTRSQNTSELGNAALSIPHSSQSTSDFHAARVGLVKAKKIGWIQPLTVEWLRTIRAISFLKRGDSTAQAARKAGLSPFVLMGLIKWGSEPNPNFASF
ncbi:hypothetical protein B7486_42380 [cyanobacterium TDX16]|nr:hypothetical protein B7486_42380 [cyanobacterium TDX16]